MWIARAVLASVLGGIAVLVGVLQVGALIAARRQNRSYSLVPFVGAILGGVLACVVAPWRNALYAIPVFLVLDPTPVMFAAIGLASARGHQEHAQSLETRAVALAAAALKLRRARPRIAVTPTESGVESLPRA